MSCKFLSRISLIFFLLGFGCAGGKTEAPPDNPLAKPALSIGEQQITVEQFNQFLGSRIGEFTEHGDIDKVKSQLLDEYVEEQLLDHEAQRLGLAAGDDEVKAYLNELDAGQKEVPAEAARQNLQAEIKRHIRIQRYIRDQLMKDFTPDAAVVQKYYTDHGQDFQVPDRVHVKEILVSSADEAERILGLLKSGQYKNFGQMAKLYSVAPSSANEGDMGTFARGDLPEEMEKVFFENLAPGRVSPIIQTKYGYHIFMLMERLPAYREPLQSVKERIANTLTEQRQKEVIAEAVTKLKSTTPVVIYRENLDFSYNVPDSVGGSKQ